MPGTSATGSPDIAILDSLINASLCDGTICVDTTPTIYIADGADNVLGAEVEILNPFGIIVKPYGSTYEIAPGLSGAMDAAVCFAIPTVGGNYQYGKYTVNVKMFDSEGNYWIVTKTVTICQPDINNKSRNYGSLSAKMNVNCVSGKLFVITDTVPNYNGSIVESQVITGTLDYPTASGLSPLTITTGSFAVTLFEGVYKLVGEICATYNFGDNVFVEVKYKIKKEHNARCLIDECCLFSNLAELQLRTTTDCTDAEKEATASIIVEALNLYTLIKLAGNCGEDPSDYIDELEKLLGCKCTCNCNEGAPIINTIPTGDFVIEGCNVGVSVNGLTTTYTIENYEYVVDIAPNGGALVVAAATLDGCTKTQLITFDISVVYSQIKTLANQNNTEADFWASVVNKSLRNVDPLCIGISEVAWQAMTFAQKFEAMMSKFCACCGTCDATITNVVVAQQGNDVILSWQGTAAWYEIYLDGLLVSTILTSAWPSDTYTNLFTGASNGSNHTWIVIAKCADKSTGETETGEFQYLGCAEISAPVFVEGAVTSGRVSGTCNYDLTALIDGGNPYTVEWHSANNTLEGTIVDNPASVGGGVYYAFNKDGNCFSPGQIVTLICDSEASCTSPQNLEVVVFGVYNFFVKFQSAAYPPPSNSYTVKRRLASDPDVGGSYTTIGTPVWNATLNRWVIADVSAVDNTLYVYRAISNCGSTEPSVDVAYANVVCPALTLYPSFDTVDYSFTAPANATTILVKIYDSTGIVLIQTDTYTPAYASPVTGTFIYLDPLTTYKVRLEIAFASGSAEVITTCSFQSVTTDVAP